MALFDDGDGPGHQVRTRLLRLASGPPVCGTVPGDSQWVP